MELDIIETVGNYRARLESDVFATKPDDDEGALPVLQVGGDYYGSGPAESFNRQADGFEDAFNRFGDCARSNAHQREIFARYVRVFHGALKVQEWNVGVSREYGYIAFDTAAWREAMGITDVERLTAEDYLHDVRAWADGDAYGVIVEHTDEEDPDDETDWTPVEDASLWGLLGREYAEQAARDQLAYYGES